MPPTAVRIKAHGSGLPMKLRRFSINTFIAGSGACRQDYEMKKIYLKSSVIALGLALSGNMYAQQLPNSDFEAEWVDCVPWTFFGSEDSYGELSTVVTGTNPSHWTISNVSGMCSLYEGEAVGLGATVVGEKAEGMNSATAVQLKNSPNPFMATQIVPAYISLGTTWSTANPAFGLSGIEIKNSDGGAFGGVEFTARPKGIEFWYKRSRGTAKPDETSTVVAYLWKGHWTQKDVPATIYMVGEPYCVEMVDRDRCVLGMDMEGCQGGAVEQTDDAELIAVINATITNNTDEWTKFSATFDYKSDATPEMMNIIIASGDYFGGADAVGEDNTLIIDNFSLVYDEVAEGDAYPGKLTIEMAGSPLTPEPVDATVNISYSSDDKCTITLPDFTLDLGSGPANLGDIVVSDVTVAPENNVAKYTGEVKDMSLMDGAIIADVNLNGTIDAEGNANFDITVLWMGIDINVNFIGKGKPGKGTSGITTIEGDDNSEAEYYTLQGVRVNAAELTPGAYIIRQGNKVSKRIIR